MQNPSAGGWVVAFAPRLPGWLEVVFRGTGADVTEHRPEAASPACGSHLAASVRQWGFQMDDSKVGRAEDPHLYTTWGGRSVRSQDKQGVQVGTCVSFPGSSLRQHFFSFSSSLRNTFTKRLVRLGLMGVHENSP